MTLREYYASQPETLGMFELAWEQRYLEGERLLLTEDTRAGGIYLLGYVAEMVMKAAYFRFTGAESEDRVLWLIEGKEFKDVARQVGSPSEHNHSIEFWLEALLNERKRKNRTLPRHLQMTLQTYVQTIHNGWSVEMRYLALQFSGTEWREYQTAIQWLKNRHQTLWR